MPVQTKNQALNQFVQWLKATKPEYIERYFAPGKKVGVSIGQLAGEIGYNLDETKKTAAILNEIREHIIAHDSD